MVDVGVGEGEVFVWVDWRLTGSEVNQRLNSPFFSTHDARRKSEPKKEVKSMCLHSTDPPPEPYRAASQTIVS